MFFLLKNNILEPFFVLSFILVFVFFSSESCLKEEENHCAFILVYFGLNAEKKNGNCNIYG